MTYTNKLTGRSRRFLKNLHLSTLSMVKMEKPVISRFLMDFIETGHVNIYTEYLNLTELSRFCTSVHPFDNHQMLSTLTQILYGVPQERVVVARTSTGDKVLTGDGFLNLVHSMTSENIMFDAKNARFVLKRTSKFCLSVSMLIKHIESAKLSDAIAKLCPDESVEFRDAVLTNLNNCNRMFSQFRHPVCIIDCDDNKVLQKFEGLF